MNTFIIHVKYYYIPYSGTWIPIQESNKPTNPNSTFTGQRMNQIWTVTILLRGVLLQAFLLTAFYSRGMRTTMTGHRAASPQLAMDSSHHEILLSPPFPGLWISLNSRGVGAAMARSWVAGETLVLHTAWTTSAGSGTLFQLIHIKVQGIADVGLTILFFLWKNHTWKKVTHPYLTYAPELLAQNDGAYVWLHVQWVLSWSQEMHILFQIGRLLPSFSSSFLICRRSGCRFM